MGNVVCEGNPKSVEFHRRFSAENPKQDKQETKGTKKPETNKRRIRNEGMKKRLCNSQRRMEDKQPAWTCL